MKREWMTLTLAAALCVPWTARAQFAKPEDAVRYRHAAFSLMANHFSRIGAVVKGEKPYDKTTVEADATLVETLAKLPWPAFTAGSNLANSKAKPEVWSEQDKFKSAADKLQADTAKLSVAAKSGDVNMIKTAFSATAQSCKACHDNFKNK